MKHRLSTLVLFAVLSLFMTTAAGADGFSPDVTNAARNTPSLGAVKAFLQARQSHDFDAAYRLLLPGGLMTPYTVKQYQTDQVNEEFQEGRGIRQSTLRGVFTFFYDIRDAARMKFDCYGVEPKHENVVLVHFQSDEMDAPQTIQIATVRNPKDRFIHLDAMASVKLADPHIGALLEQDAMQSRSQHNMRLITIGIIKFMMDNDEHLPDARHWMDQILPYIKSESVLRDPAAPADEKYSYAFNRNLSRKTASELSDPDKAVLIFESSANRRNASDLGFSRPKPGRHHHGSDYILVNSHVYWVADTKPFPSFKL